MFLPPLCVSIQIGAPPAALQSAVVLEESCDGVLGKGSCRIEDRAARSADGRAGCWSATVKSLGAGSKAATVVLHEPGGDKFRAEQTVSFRPQDAPNDRWAALGLLVAALVTVQQYAAEAAPPAPLPEPIPPPTPEPVVEAPRVVVRPTPPEPRPALEWDLRAAGLVAVGQIPGVAWGVRVETTLGRQGLAGLARLSFLPRRTRTIEGSATLGGNFQLLAPGAGACWTSAPRGRLLFRLCGGGDLYLMEGRGFGVAEPDSISTVSGAAWVGSSAALSVFRHAALVAGVEGAAAIMRPSFEFTGGSDIYSPAPVAASALLGLAVSY